MLRGSLSLYEQRLIVKIVELAQERVKGLLLEKNMRALDHDLDNIKYEISSRSVLDEDSHHYEDVISAARSLSKKTVEFWSEDKSEFFVSSIIYNVRYYKGSGILSFYVSKSVFDAILDFRRGFSRYDINIALSLPTAYSARLYAWMCNQSHPISMGIDKLKAWLGCSCYNQTMDFVKRVIAPSQKYIEQANGNYFTYDLLRDGEHKTARVTGIMFRPMKRVAASEPELCAQLSVARCCDPELLEFLLKYWNFSRKELSAHKALLLRFCSMPDFWGDVYRFRPYANRARNPKGYVISAIKKATQTAPR